MMLTGSYRSKVDWASTVRCTKTIGSPPSTGCCYSEEASYSADLLNDFLEVAQAEQENPEPVK
ncbi:hypothetical protein T10_4646 [Trichinella papuae]|uniref:Uncharacterized protein n=1 Tax=Trichinella papuae TaxID=268474 RepID=A0A0V1MD91_9BILA|nr:hypothetical protein T10_4646 [Trichinella papuae]